MRLSVRGRELRSGDRIDIFAGLLLLSVVERLCGVKLDMAGRDRLQSGNGVLVGVDRVGDFLDGVERLRCAGDKSGNSRVDRAIDLRGRPGGSRLRLCVVDLNGGVNAGLQFVESANERSLLRGGQSAEVANFGEQALDVNISMS